MTIALGRLTALDVRQIWQSEPQDFTAWLAEAENIDMLGESLGLKLEFEARERRIGQFAADIIARDLTQNAVVVIENQLEPTDHRHLGQIITYAAGMQAQVLVWIAPEFRPEHRAAVDWLNQSSIAGIDFFAVRVEAYRIGDSLPAPRFNVICRPNNWVRDASRDRKQIEAEPTARKQRWSAYWNGLKVAAGSRFPALSNRATASGNYQQVLSVSKDDLSFGFSLVGSREGMRVELYIDFDLAKAAFRSLQNKRASLETTFGQPLTWDLLPDNRASRISAYMPGYLLADHTSPQAQYEWLIETGPKFIAVFRPLVEKMDSSSLIIAEQDQIEG